MKHWLDTVLVLLKSDTADLRELCKIAGGNPATFYRGTDISKLDLSEADRDFLQTSEISAAIQKVRKAVRQEERVALWLAEILLNREVGLCALQQYVGERAKFANRARVIIRQSFSAKEKSTKQDILIVSSLVSKLYSEVFPYNRGALLFFLSKHLALYPQVNAAIVKAIDRSKSMFVVRMRDQILKELKRLEF